MIAIWIFLGICTGIAIAYFYSHFVQNQPLCQFPLTCQTVRKRILHGNPEARAHEGDENDAEHTLWMLEQLPTFINQGKIDRWMGWILAKTHTLGLLTLKEARDLVRQDRLQTSP